MSTSSSSFANEIKPYQGNNFENFNPISYHSQTTALNNKDAGGGFYTNKNYNSN